MARAYSGTPARWASRASSRSGSGSRYRSGPSKDWLKFKNPEAPGGEARGRRKVGLDPNGGASMANDEHVAMLKKGVRAWNEWRDENPNVVTWRSEDTNVPYYPGPVLDLTNAARRHTHHYRDASFASSAAIFMAHPKNLRT